MYVTLWKTFEVAANIVEMALVWMLIQSFFEEENPKWFRSTSVVLFQGTLLTILNKLFPPGSIATLFVVSISWLIICNLIYNKKVWYKSLLLIGVSIAVLIVAELIILIAIQISFSVPPVEMQESNVYRFITIVLSKLLAYYIIGNINYFKLKISMRKKIQSLNISIVFIINLVMTFFMFDIYHEIGHDVDIYFGKIILITVVVCIANVLTITLIHTISKYIEGEINADIQKQQYQIQLRQIEESNKLIKVIRQKQHDYNNHLSTLLSLLLCEKYEGAKGFLHELIADNKNTNYVIQTSHSLIAIMIHYKVEQAREYHIDVSCNVDVPNDLNMNVKDIAIIINNVIDNAIEACSYVEEAKRYMKIDVYMKGAYLNIFVENASDGYYHRVNQTLMTRKPNANEHGHGLNNIKYILEKNNGFLQINPKEDHFIFKCSLMIQTS